MCHSSPTAQVLGTMVTAIGSIFVGWHIWCFDRGRCLIYKRRDAFRWLIMWMLIISLCLFMVWNSILTHIKYSEYYIQIPISATETKIVPVPFQLWSQDRQILVRNSYYILSVAWALLLAVHSEETLYWAYLIGAIRSRHSRPWFSSAYFKIWVVGCLCVMGVMLGSAHINTVDLTKMEGNIFMAGSVFAFIFLFASSWLVYVFPSFIRESRRQGANSEVISRLQYFKQLNGVRTLFRAIYASALLTLAVDGYTEHHWLNTSPFWLDVLFIIGFFSVFTSTAISLLILLPRNMLLEAGLTHQANVFVRQDPQPTQPSITSGHPHTSKSALTSPTDVSVNIPSDRESHTSSPTPSPWIVLGERLNIDKEIIEDLDDGEAGIGMYDLPFAALPGSRRLGDDEAEVCFSSPPRALDNFTSPLDVRSSQSPVDLAIVVTSSVVVERDLT